MEIQPYVILRVFFLFVFKHIYSVTTDNGPLWEPWRGRGEKVLRILMHVVKDDWNWSVSRNNRKKVCRGVGAWTGTRTLRHVYGVGAWP